MVDDLTTHDLLVKRVRVHCVVLGEQPLEHIPVWGVFWGPGESRRVTAVIALGKRPVPFRTR